MTVGGRAHAMGGACSPMTHDAPASTPPSPPKTGMRLGSFRKNAEHLQALENIKRMTRERFQLDDAVPVLVSEIECGLPGCPPLETVVAFWTTETTRHHFKVFKPAAQVAEDDLPFRWMKNALIVPEGMGCDCC